MFQSTLILIGMRMMTKIKKGKNGYKSGGKRAKFFKIMKWT